MKDYSFWRDALNTAKSPLLLKSVGEELGKFQAQTDFLKEQEKLTPTQVESLRKLYKSRWDKLAAEALPKPAPGPKNRKK